MRRPVLLLIAVVMTAVLLARSAAPVAHACFSNAPIASAEIIVAGRITGWRIADESLVGETRLGSLTPVEVRMDVHQTIKGQATQAIQFIDWVYTTDGKSAQFGGDSCSPFRKDPTGSYAILALSVQEGSLFPWPANRTYLGTFGDEQEYRTNVSKLRSELQSDPPLLPIIAAGIAIPLAFLLGAAFVWRWSAGA